MELMSEGGRRRAGRAERAGKQPKAPQPRRPFAAVELATPEQIERIHQESLKVLEELGIDVLHDGAVAFCSVASAPNAADRDGGRRPGNRVDYQNLIRLGQSLDAVHLWGGYPVEPADIHASVRHLDALYDMLTLSDKAVHAYSLGAERNIDALELVRIARGIDDATLDREPSVFTIINSNSPLRLDVPMMEGIIQMAKRNQPIVLTPFTLAGAMAPVTIAGAIVEQNAEALAGLVFTQSVNRCAFCVWGVYIECRYEIGSTCFWYA